MAKKPNIRNINLGIESGTFTGIFRRLRGEKKGYDFGGISDVRQLLSNERARIIHTIKTQAPNSIYHLAKLLDRDFKSVRKDVKLLEKFGFLENIILLKENSNAPGIIADIGKQLRNCKLSAIRSDRIRTLFI